MLEFTPLHPAVTPRHLGFLPTFVDPTDPRSAAAQFDANYQFGGWRPFEGFKLNDDNSLSYPGDPTKRPIATATLRDETICVYEHAWVAVIQPDRSFQVCRMD